MATYFKSTEIYVYPAGFRGQNYPQSRLTTEQNTINLNSILDNSIKLTSNSSYCLVKIAGYTFGFGYYILRSHIQELLTSTSVTNKKVILAINQRKVSDSVGYVLDNMVTSGNVLDNDTTENFEGLQLTLESTSGLYYLVIGTVTGNINNFDFEFNNNVLLSNLNTENRTDVLNAITIGRDSDVTISSSGNADKGIAIGCEAVVKNAENAVQIGTGTNQAANTFKYLNKIVVNYDANDGNYIDADKLNGEDASFYAATASLVTEINNRTTWDASLQTNINNEATTRQTYDISLQNSINTINSYFDSSTAKLANHASYSDSVTTYNNTGASLGQFKIYVVDTLPTTRETNALYFVKG